MQACISTQSAAAAPAVQTFCTPSTLYRPTGRGTDGFLLCVCSCLPRIAGAAVPCPALSVAAALRYLHEEAGIAHGDVKGRNELLGSRDAQGCGRSSLTSARRGWSPRPRHPVGRAGRPRGCVDTQDCQVKLFGWSSGMDYGVQVQYVRSYVDKSRRTTTANLIVYVRKKAKGK